MIRQDEDILWNKIQKEKNEMTTKPAIHCPACAQERGVAIPKERPHAKPASHTPGPWKATGRSVNAEGEDRNVCVVRHSSHEDADARLIAAAPEMLEALEIMERAFNVPEIDPLIAMASIEKARAAIAKAQGDTTT